MAELWLKQVLFPNINAARSACSSVQSNKEKHVETNNLSLRSNNNDDASRGGTH